MSGNHIIFVEDDLDDQEIIKFVFSDLKLNYELKFFRDGMSAFDYLAHEDVNPFIIFSDINMPGWDGFTFRAKMLSHAGIMQKRCPFIFLTTSDDDNLRTRAAALSVQGFFIKPLDLKSWEKIIAVVVRHWQK